MHVHVCKNAYMYDIRLFVINLYEKRRINHIIGLSNSNIPRVSALNYNIDSFHICICE